MLNKEQITQLFDRLDMPRAGRELILKARTLAPVRQVQSRGGNVITLLASRKMGREIPTESRHIEFAAAVDHEHDPAVLEYYAQPTELKLELVDTATGEIRQIQHFPDFLVILSIRLNTVTRSHPNADSQSHSKTDIQSHLKASIDSHPKPSA